MPSEHEPQPGGRLRHLLVCFDGSGESKRATELALDLGKHLGADLTLYSVLPDTSHLETNESRSAAEHAARDNIAAELLVLSQRGAGEGVRIVEADAVGGDPADRIIGYADEHGFDLIVVGSHGQERTTHGGLGRVVERLVLDPHCPILVVPDRTTG